jgi:anti-sigma B factor antagonist
MSLGETLAGDFRVEVGEGPATTSGHAAIVVRLVGRLDAASHDACDRRLGELVSSGTTRFVLDCADLTFVSSMGIGALLRLLRTVKPRGGGVSVCRANDAVRQTLMLAGLGKVLLLEPDVDSAARHL